jgi:hypothetical protein
MLYPAARRQSDGLVLQLAYKAGEANGTWVFVAAAPCKQTVESLEHR